MSPQIAVALDQLDPKEVDKAVDELASVGISWFKIGLELYIRGGNTLVKRLKSRGLKIFLDLKLHDIPKTVEQAVAAAVPLEIDLMTVHCMGGSTMMQAAARATKGSQTQIVGVTLLTSLSDDALLEIAPAGAAAFDVTRRLDWISSLSRMAAEAGLHGIVCSAQDLAVSFKVIKQFSWNSSPLFVTPGIRSEKDADGDQSRVATPEAAVKNGSGLLVIGRPIMQPDSGTRGESAKKFLSYINKVN